MTKIDWSKPLELKDGTAVKLADKCQQPDSSGDYLLEREDGGKFTDAQAGAMRSFAFWKSDGTYWGGNNYGLPVRNRPLRRRISIEKIFWLTVFGCLIVSGGWMLGTHIDNGTSAGFIVADILVLIASCAAFALTSFGED